MTVTEELPHTDEELREAALERLKKKQDLRAHLLVYVLVNALLWTIWALTGTGFVWPAIVSAGWGVGLVMNVWDVYGRRPIGEADVQHEVERLRGSR
jgi:2TM domain